MATWAWSRAWWRASRNSSASDALVIATGGLADYVLSETDVVDVHDPILTLKGLRLYYERNVACP